MRTTPLVLIAYNRPDNIRRLIEKLARQRPKHVIFAVDGPKTGKRDDAKKVLEVQSLTNLFNWPVRLETRFRDTNLGLKDAVTDVVTYANSEYGQAIILEEDTIPGRNWLPFAEVMLERYSSDPSIEHISGYNLVPERVLGTRGVASRLSRYPESFAWATWERAWKNYDDSLEWGLNASIGDLRKIVGTRSGALRWRQNFLDAKSGRISSWAYRWISSMWSRGSFVLSPNQNLVSYTGYGSGTHSTMKVSWEELELYEGQLDLGWRYTPSLDTQADQWTAKKVFAETPFGVSRGIAISAALQARKFWRDCRSRPKRSYI